MEIIMFDKKIDIARVKAYADQFNENTVIYVGCDSERIKVNDKWHADYITAVVIHIDGRHGCKIFGQVDREPDYDRVKNRPRLRLMNEVYRAADMYLKVAQAITDKEIVIHLDINPNEVHGSSVVINEAIGYIKGMCNVVPMVKPEAWCATFVADRFKELKVA
jgi:uncharacterized protein